MPRAIFLDRDGVLNKITLRGGKVCPPASITEFEVLPGVSEACEALRAAGFLLVVVTNQPDVARGSMRKETVELINEALRAQVAIDDIRVCYHDDHHQCFCRKPSPGLLREAAADWGIDILASFLVGDRWRDIEAGRRAGCRTILIDGADEDAARSQPDHRARSLAEAVPWILQQAPLAPRR